MTGNRLRRIKRRLVLLRPRRVAFEVGGREFQIYGTWSANRGLGHDFARNGCHEPVLSRRLVAALERAGPDAVCWDVGAGLGYFVAIAGHLLPPANIHAFEPGPNHAWLRYNNRRLFQGRARLFRAFAAEASDPARNRLALDDHAMAHGDPDVVKIDVDGSEARVLKGMRRVLERARPLLFLEVHFVGGPPYPELRESLIRRLEGLDYRFRLCRNHRRPDGTLVPIDSLSELPRERDATFDDNDYLLVAEPA